MFEDGVNILHDGYTLGAISVSRIKSRQDAEVAKASISAWLAQI